MNTDPLPDPNAAAPKRTFGRPIEEVVLGFCGFLTADIPELHGVHPQKIADSWERFKGQVADGFTGLDFGDAVEQHENGDGR